ncbi:MAG TPA: PH domain-containing protein [Candidatus Paceibacterota bacterium]|nr:PH domain-containing protein [Candidatus Paceibacterota bacterium]
MLGREFELESGEKVLREVRMHWFFFLARLLPYLVLAVLPFFLPPVIRLAGPALAPLARFGGWGAPLARVALGVWWLFLWSAAFNIYTRYFLNAWIITSLRIVEIEQRGFFNREVSSLLLNRVEDVTIDTRGLMHSLLDIGDINVQTAGAVDRFTMGNVPAPAQLRDLILAHSAIATGQAGPPLA